jgi:acetolactate synthase-1/2/3 large subunit
MRGADLLIKALAKAGVTRIFSLSGNQIMPIYDACVDAGIEIVHTRHEAAAVFMADAYAQLTGSIGVAMVAAAPGAANALGPLFTARQSESPVLFLTGDSPTFQDGLGAFQELDQIPMTTPLTKLSFRAMKASNLGHDMAHAIGVAQSGRPGPVHMALPFDVLNADATGGNIATVEMPVAFELQPDELTRIQSALNAAKQPLILLGPALNATRADDLSKRLEIATDTPVIVMESPRGLKDPALGNVAQAVEQADLIVALGKSVNFSVDYGKTTKCPWIIIDAEVEEIDRAYRNLKARIALAVHCDPNIAVKALQDGGCGGDVRRAWRVKVAALIAARSYSVTDTAPSGKITPAALIAAVQRQLVQTTSSVAICDGGEFGQWAQAGTSGTSRIINGPSGAIGGALCYALAAKKARPNATVFAMMGDGTVGFHFAEFETAVRENTPFVVVIGNDSCWNAEHQIQMRNYGPDRLIGCQLSAARYDQAVKGLGGHGEYVTRLADLDAALIRAVNSGKAACVNVEIEGIPAPVF